MSLVLFIRTKRRPMLVASAGMLAALALSAAAPPTSASQKVSTIEAKETVAPIVGGRTYWVRQLSTSRYADAWNDAGHNFRMETENWQNDTSQRWTATALGNNIYRFRQVSSQQYMDAYETGGNDFAMHTRPYQANNSQRWRAILVSDGVYRLQQVSTGQYMDAYEAGGYRMMTRTYQPNNSQRWRFLALP